MRRFKLGYVKALVWATASLALWCGSTAAFAQAFDFTFLGSGGSASGIFNVVANGSPGKYDITGLTGTVSGFASSSYNGAMSLVTPGSFATVFNTGPNDNILQYPNTPYLDFQGVAFTVSGGAEEDLSYDCDFTCFDLISTPGGTNGPFSAGTLSITQTPAPIPGVGLLSYLVLGLGGLFINRKRLWRAGPRTQLS